MSGAPNKWTQIQVTNKKASELQDLEINLEEDLEEQEENGGEQSPNRNADNRQVQETKKDKDSEVRPQVVQSKKVDVKEGSQVGEDEDSEQVPGQSRRARRIRFLSTENAQLKARLAEVEQEKTNAVKQTRTFQANHAASQKDFYAKRVDEKATEYEKAVESNDPKAQAKALKDLNDAQINLKVYEAAAQETEDEEPEVQTRTTRTQQPQGEAPEAAVKWVERNKWFLTNRTAHIATRDVNGELMQEGYDPNSEDFYQELDSRLEERGMNLKKLRGDKEPVQQEEKAQPQRKRGSPVGSSEGDDTGGRGERTQFKREGNKVLVNPTDEDREFADDMGIPIENFMQNKLIYEEHNGKGYIPIVVRKKK